MKAVIDRIEGEIAVLLVGEDELTLDVPIRLLPNGASEGTWMTISFELDLKETERRKNKVSALLSKLKKKNS